MFDITDFRDNRRVISVVKFELTTCYFIFMRLYVIGFVLICNLISDYLTCISCDKTCIITHCGLVMPYGNIEQGQHWFR